MHDTDFGALFAGALLAAFGVAGLIRATGQQSLPWWWLLPALLVGLGIAGILHVTTRGDR